ncbi:synaptosomal-associated protein 23-like [Myxocyprinus asiaticus]|uniref:synaptosomal-associated protein 23-like n=1 Tax=Myxocyprinus asiaticus TaxID=70543 RepID=UPI00222218CE|nr:synaptosomal-associated protein 23-like [Myxocyprinus asiaticus]XP_051502678.1 synaptosomal-associated protein 23-like [Myxocyprinus asiaticus]
MMADMSAEEITIKADQVTDESLESTRRMLQMAEESMDVGIKTVTMLDEQGEKLRRVEEGVDQIRQDMKQAQKNLNELSKCCGLCLCPCNRLKSIENDRRYKQVWGTAKINQGVVSSQLTAVQNKQAVSVGSVAPSGPYIKRITNDEREDEMEKNLEQVGSIIGNIKSMAQDMGNEIDHQTDISKKLIKKVEMLIDHVDRAKHQADNCYQRK